MSNEVDASVPSDSDSTGNEEECLQMLLGGLDIEDMSLTAWAHQEEEEVVAGCDGGGNQTSRDGYYYGTKNSSNINNNSNSNNNDQTLLHGNAVSTNNLFPNNYHSKPYSEHENIFRLAYQCGSPENGSQQKPPVQVVGFQDENLLGNGLIATKLIPKGSVIWTERSAVTIQHPSQAPAAGATKTSVRACQNCFRSMEPISKLYCSKYTQQKDSCPNDEELSLPQSNFWPVPEYSLEQNNHDYDETQTTTPTKWHVYNHGRIECQDCHTWYCSRYCQKEHFLQQGSCCQLSDIQTRARTRLVSENDNKEHLQSAVVLAIRMFALLLHQYRQTGTIRGSALDGLCGESQDIVTLELGERHETPDKGFTYTLQTLYEDMVSVWSMTDAEQAILSCKKLHQLVSIAARNGIDMATESPFSVYYAALLRATGGRGSHRHEQIKTDVARCLNRSSNTTQPSHQLERGMDALVQSLVVPQVSGIFPLTARMNHSCQPNVQILNQQFVDARIDLVALEDIPVGQELCISYIGYGHGMGRRTRHQRQRLLQSHYLFTCRCPKCESI